MLVLALLAAAEAAPANRLSMFTPFVGSCWRSHFSATVEDTHCFEPMYGGAHVRDRHEVQENGKTIYAGETIYSADGPDLVFTYVNSLGGVGQGTFRPGTGTTIRFAGKMRASPDRAQQPIDSEWRLLGDDRYEVRSLVKDPSGTVDKPLIFTRVK